MTVAAAPTQVASPQVTAEQIAALPIQEQEALSSLLLDSTLSRWAPNPGPQALGYLSEADELFFGGAAGGGKTALIAGLALTAHQRTLVIRRESTQLRGLIDDLARLLGTRDGLNNQAGQWRIPPALSLLPDQLIEFGGVPNPGDEERHQGIAHDLLAFDEVTQISEYVVDYLTTWNRSVRPGQRCRILLTSNPPTPSTQYARNNRNASNGLWLIRRYAPWLDPQYRDPLGLGPAEPGELRYFVTLDGAELEHPDPLPFWRTTASGRQELITPRSRTFIPALPTDNPYLGDNYVATLQKLPEPLRSALLYGDFSVSLTDQPYQLFPSEWVRAATTRHRNMTSANPPPTHNVEMTSIGVDVARGGTDNTVIQPRYGAYFPPPILVPTTTARTGPQVASEILKHRRDGCQVVIDANGIGASVYDHLTGALGLENITPHVGSSKAHQRDLSSRYGFANLRSQVYWKLREALDPASDQQLAIPDDPELVNELLAMTWQEQSGKIKVIAKEDLIKTLGHSPDKADALTLAHRVFDESSPVNQDRRSAREARVQDARRLRRADPYAHPALGCRNAVEEPLRASNRPRRARWSDANLPRTHERW